MNLKNNDVISKTGISILLAVAILAIYWQVVNYSFILFDDEDYVLLNSRLRIGFTFENIYWFLTSSYAANWHPVTWFSHILDVKLFGLNAMGHHLTSVVLHGANSILLFLFLQRFTGSIWRSAAVAALFAIHPLNVESVAWISERKNVLSTLFWLLTLYFYASYAKQKSKTFYIFAIFTFILGLMSKQMLVSIPFVLLLLDYWPLHRIPINIGTKLSRHLKSSEFRSLLLEKVPFLILAASVSVITVVSQQKAMNSLLGYSLTKRFANAATSYTQYLRKTFWPNDLGVFYPFPESIPLWEAIASTAVLIVVTSAALKLRARYPVLFVGWLWYLITLVPVIGIVKIGLQSMADRYAYIPSIGIFIIVVWSLADLFHNRPRSKLVLSCITGLCIILLSVNAWLQTSYWKDTMTLFTHTLASTKDNYIALCAIGRELETQGKYNEALQKFDEAIVVAPWYDSAQTHQGIMLMKRGMFEAAIIKFNKALAQNPTSVPAHINLGIVMALQDRPEEAIQHFQIAVKLEPRSAAANYNLAFTLYKLGKPDEAISHYAIALATDPIDHECHNNLGIALAGQERYNEAIRHFKEALRIKPDFLDAGNNLELALQKQRAASRP